MALCCSFDDCLQILSIWHALPRPSLHTHICSAEFSCPRLHLSVHTPASERTALALSPRWDEQELTSYQELLYLSIEMTDLVSFLPGLRSCLYSLVFYLPSCWSFPFSWYSVVWCSVTQLGDTTRCFVVRSQTMCSLHLRPVGFHKSVYPATTNDIVLCIIASSSFIRTQFKPLRHLACLIGTGSGRHRYLNRIQVW